MSKKTKEYYEENQRLKADIRNIIKFGRRNNLTNLVAYCQRILKKP